MTERLTAVIITAAVIVIIPVCRRQTPVPVREDAEDITGVAAIIKKNTEPCRWTVWLLEAGRVSFLRQQFCLRQPEKMVS